MPYQLFCKSVRGASHIKRDIPCEDYGLKYENSEIGCKIFVLGDGHGDPNCVRSDVGSRAVCEIAVKELRVFAEFLNESKKNSMGSDSKKSDADGWISSQSPNLVETLLNPDTAYGLLYQLIRSIVGKWGIYVNEHYENNPFTDEEKEIASEMLDVYQRGDFIEHIYGTTMIAGLMTEDYLLLLHQGDGRCVVFDCNGAASQPIPWDDRCVGNIATSMCEYDAVESCRYHIIDLKKNPIIACVLGSDGVEDSFSSMDRMHIFYREQLAIACEKDMGVKKLETYWESSLPTFSARGSQDDVTICGVMDIDAFREKLELMDVENDILFLKESIEQIDKRIPQMKAKEEFLFNQKRDGAIAYHALEEKKRKLDKEYDDIQRDIMQKLRLSMTSRRWLEHRLEMIRKEKIDLDKELSRAEAEQNARITEYEEYKKEREALEDTRVYKAEKLKECRAEYDAILNPAPISAPISQNETDKKQNPAAEPQGLSVTIDTEIEKVVMDPNEWNGSTEKPEIRLREESECTSVDTPTDSEEAHVAESQAEEPVTLSEEPALQESVVPEFAVQESECLHEGESETDVPAEISETEAVSTEKTETVISEPVPEEKTETTEW